eukprot:scaffold86708_cov78-Phaeocystis_antarctica.AAC.1
MNTQCTQRCGRPPSKHRLSLRYQRQGSFFVGAAAVRADQGQPKDDAQSSQRGAKHEKRKNTSTGAQVMARPLCPRASAEVKRGEAFWLRSAIT